MFTIWHAKIVLIDICDLNMTNFKYKSYQLLRYFNQFQLIDFKCNLWIFLNVYEYFWKIILPPSQNDSSIGQNALNKG